MVNVGRDIESANVLKQLHATKLIDREKNVILINGLTFGETDLGALSKQHIVSSEDVTIHVKKREKNENKGSFNILALSHH